MIATAGIAALVAFGMVAASPDLADSIVPAHPTGESRCDGLFSGENFGPIVFYSGTNGNGLVEADQCSGWEFSDHDEEKYGRWTSDTPCSTESAANFPSDRGLSTLVGWSLGRLGPIYFLLQAPDRWGEINSIYLLDPGHGGSMSGADACEGRLPKPPATVLREWLETSDSRRLVIYAGSETQQDGGAGIDRFYLSEVLNTALVNHVVYCNVDRGVDHGGRFINAYLPSVARGETCPGSVRQLPGTPAVAPTPSGTPQTTGGVANTWTDFTNAGGEAGPQIAANQTVLISCRVEGFQVEDGNTWWYRIGEAPWSDRFYVSADIFYNVPGMTSGGLEGTPFVDESVRMC